ncbi:hypothetical protein [Leadbetterella sp. DM7]|uniref:hypothetical protein n=1 Tax=Leadbetterella sp. DM7 TaxID=3235085 RepID=UPI00349EFF8D
MNIFRLIYLSSLHVALATGACAAAFFELTGGTEKHGRGSIPAHWVSLAQIVLVCWLIYILDRILDVVRGNTSTERHRFHFENQYNLQLLAIALAAINIFLLFFQSREVIVYGVITGALVLLYLVWIVPRYPKAKDYSMPLIYLAAVVGVPFVSAPSVTLSAWLIAFMFALLVFQNLTSFAYFEQGKASKRKTVTVMGALNLFLFIVFFSGSTEYVSRLALIFTGISVFYSFIINNEKRFSARYRWIMDGLLFLPLLIL